MVNRMCTPLYYYVLSGIIQTQQLLKGKQDYCIYILWLYSEQECSCWQQKIHRLKVVMSNNVMDNFVYWPHVFGLWEHMSGKNMLRAGTTQTHRINYYIFMFYFVSCFLFLHEWASGQSKVHKEFILMWFVVCDFRVTLESRATCMTWARL